MKKLILFLTGLMMTVIATSQTTIYNDLILQKTTPRFYLNGTGALIDFNGDIIFTQSANLLTLSGGNLSIGANNFYITGSLGQTGTRILKGWFADLEVTNTPTINGISVATIFAPINNPTFIGTVVLPVTTSIGTVSSTEIDYLDNVTSSIQTQFGVKANINNPSFTGIVTLPATTSIGTISSTEIGYVDGTTSSIQNQFNDTTSLSVSIANPPVSTIIQTQIDASLASYGGGASGKFYYLKGRIGVTDGFPVAGDSTLMHSNFTGKHITVFREGQLQHQNTDNTKTDGYWFNNTTGTATFRPVLAVNEQLEIWATNTIQWEALSGEDATPSTLLTGLRAGWKLDETAGTSVADVSGVYPGVTTGLVNQSGKFGVAETFTRASSQDASFGTTVGDIETNDFSVACWVYSTNDSYLDYGIMGNWGSEPYYYLQINGVNHYALFYIKFGTTPVEISSDAIIPINTWTHIAVTVDRSGNGTMYINGVAQTDVEDVSADVAVNVVNNSVFNVGNIGENNTGYYFDGTIDDVYLWTKVLSSAEVTELQTGTHPWN